MKGIEIFSFGGIWDECTIKNDNGELEVFKTFSILTTEANALLSKIHNNKKRMPVIIHPEEEHLCLSNELKKQEVESLMLPFPEEEMKAHTIQSLSPLERKILMYQKFKSLLCILN